MTPEQDAISDRGVWRAPAFWLLVAIVAVGYFPRLGHLPIRGEESRWGQIAREMHETGDWIVPRQQREPFYSRPPLGSWLIAGCWQWTGRLDAWAIRLPSSLAILATGIAVYLYGRSYLIPHGAFAAAVAFATMGQTLEIGRRGETDALFAFLVSAALMVWHGGSQEKEPTAPVWCAAYALAALATLAKGVHGAALFVAPIGVYLAITGRIRWWFTRVHAAGLAVYAIIVLLWLVPFAARVGWPGVRQMALGDVLMRFEDRSLATSSWHLASYPWVVLGGTLPWSAWLVAFAWREVRAIAPPIRPFVAFPVVCLVVAFLPCWLAPGARGRYFLPMFPFLGLLVGLAIEQAARAGNHVGRRLWSVFASVMALCVLLAAGGATVLALGRQSAAAWPGPSLASAVLLAGAAVVSAWVLWHSRSSAVPQSEGAILDNRDIVRGVVATGAFLSLAMTTVVIESSAYRGVNLDKEVARLKEQLPPEVQLVSFRPVHHLFSFHYQTPIRLCDWPEPVDAADPQIAYFCFNRSRGQVVELPFPWEELAVLSCDRVINSNPREAVVVGRRIPPDVAEPGLQNDRHQARRPRS